jgi:hypothetical protein
MFIQESCIPNLGSFSMATLLCIDSILALIFLSFIPDSGFSSFFFWCCCLVWSAPYLLGFLELGQVGMSKEFVNTMFSFLSVDLFLFNVS